MFGFFLELGDEAGANAVEAGEESAPNVLVAPEIFRGFGIDDGEVGISSRSGLIVIGDGILGDVAVIVDRAGLSAGEENVAAFVWVGGEQEDQV